MKRFSTLFVFFCLSSICYSSELKLSKPLLYTENGKAYAIFNLSWDNSWHNNKNNDAVWLFFKALPNQGAYQHIQVASEGHVMRSNFSGKNLDVGFEVAKDANGLFVFPKQVYRGKVDIVLKIVLDLQSLQNINLHKTTFSVYGIEMVKIPSGAFEIGDPAEKAIQYGSLFQPDEQGNFSKLLQLKSEDQEIEVAKNGDLFYETKKGYEGDQKGTIPGSFPKGVDAFYIMKYEINEEQYVNFLNTLDSTALGDRIIFESQNYYRDGGTITKQEEHFFTPFPNKPCKYLSWDDAMAYADWAALRPMTEFEFTKAARGTDKAKAGAFPWGNNNKDNVQRLPNENGELQMINGWTEENLSDSNLEYYAASFYWVMDLSGSLWERVITIGHPKGRAFNGSHGDGILSSSGSSNNENWPVEAENSGGIGFRGGGFYGYDRSYHEYNPFSPIAYRPYGGWHGGMRSIAYGSRFVRTATKK